MKWIYLTGGKYSCVDDEDWEMLTKYLWKYSCDGYAQGASKEIFCKLMHKFVLQNVNKPYVIDHINRNKLDNRRCNLRIADYSLNSRNRGAPIIIGLPTEEEKEAAKNIHKALVKKNLRERSIKYPNADGIYKYSEWYRKKLCPVINDTTGEYFNSIKEAADKYNLSVSNICACCKGRRKSTGGFKWRFFVA